MLGILRYAAHIVASLGLCTGCSVLFGGGGEGEADGGATAIDATAEPTTARIYVALPTCGDTAYAVNGASSSSPEGSYIAEYRWEISQNGAVVDSVIGTPEAPVTAGAHVLGGTAESYNLNPSLLSSPTLLKVALTGTGGVNQLYQHDFAVQDATAYELSFVAASDGEGVLNARLIGHSPANPNLGFSQMIGTSDVAQRHVFPFTTTQSYGNARLLLDFNTTTSFYVDNLQLRQVGGLPLLTNDRFDVDLQPWKVDFPGGGTATVETIPLALANFPVTTIVLVVVDSNGVESEPESTMISFGQCTPSSAN